MNMHELRAGRIVMYSCPFCGSRCTLPVLHSYRYTIAWCIEARALANITVNFSTFVNEDNSVCS